MMGRTDGQLQMMVVELSELIPDNHYSRRLMPVCPFLLSMICWLFTIRRQEDLLSILSAC